MSLGRRILVRELLSHRGIRLRTHIINGAIDWLICTTKRLLFAEIVRIAEISGAKVAVVLCLRIFIRLRAQRSLVIQTFLLSVI